MAERAGERAADLARDAERAAVFLGDVDGLDLLAVFEPKQPFPGTVDRDLFGDDFGSRQRKRGGELAPELLADIGHGGKVGRAAHIEPAPDLADPHAPLPFGNIERGKARGKRGPLEPDDWLATGGGARRRQRR